MKQSKNIKTSKIIPALFGLFVLVFILFGYYKGNNHPTINDLSSDQWNIIPVLQKWQDTTLFKHDLFLYDKKNAENYIPFYIHTALWFAAIADGDVLQGTFYFHMVTLVLYLVLWYWLFVTITKERWTAILLTLIAHGVLWPPGNEIWGISDIMYFLPRTVFSALIPLGFWCILTGITGNKTGRIILGFAICGLVGNFHPVSGMGVGFAIITAYTLYLLFIAKTTLLKAIPRVLTVSAAFFIGILPYVITYYQTTLMDKATDPLLFQEMLTVRIKASMFLHPFNLFKRYFQLQWILLLWLPFVLNLYLLLKKKTGAADRKTVQYVLIYFCCMLFAPIFFFFVEYVLKLMGWKDLSFSFQLVRTSKYAIIAAYILWAYACKYALSLRFVIKWMPQIWFIGILAIVSFVSKGFSPAMPVLGDDLFRSQWPDYYTREKFIDNKFKPLDEVVDWVNNNLPADAILIGPTPLRAGTKRSLIYDGKAASMLIESNKNEYVKWAQDWKKLKAMKTDAEKMDFYKNTAAGFVIVPQAFAVPDSAIAVVNDWKVYKIK